MKVGTSCRKTFCFSVMSTGSLGLHMAGQFGLELMKLNSRMQKVHFMG